MLTDERIHQALQHLLSASQTLESDQSEFSTPQHHDDICRLMEIYCVVKAGGVQTQIEVAQALLEREGTKLSSEIATLMARQAAPTTIAMLEQEHRDLERSVTWRIAYLQAISPTEEAVVATWSEQIESALQTKRRT